MTARSVTMVHTFQTSQRIGKLLHDFRRRRPWWVLHADDQGFGPRCDIHRAADAAGPFAPESSSSRGRPFLKLEIPRVWRHQDGRRGSSDAHLPDEKKKHLEPSVTGTFMASTVKIFFAGFARGPIPKIPFSLWK